MNFRCSSSVPTDRPNRISLAKYLSNFTDDVRWTTSPSHDLTSDQILEGRPHPRRQSRPRSHPNTGRPRRKPANRLQLAPEILTRTNSSPIRQPTKVDVLPRPSFSTTICQRCSPYPEGASSSARIRRAHPPNSLFLERRNVPLAAKSVRTSYFIFPMGVGDYAN
jgi:hypothetical protein